MERKIADQKRQIESLYDDLESREKFIEMLQEDIKDTKRQHAKDMKQLKAEKIAIERKQIVNDEKDDPSFKCPKGCDKYSKTIEEIYDAGAKHKSKLLDLKEIADDQKIKISCLRKHRDEIRDELVKLEDVHDTKMKENEVMVAQLKEEIFKLKRNNEDCKDELDLKIEEIKVLIASNKDKQSTNSLANELDDAISQMFICDECELMFQSKTELRDHIAGTHEAQTVQKINLLAKCNPLN